MRQSIKRLTCCLCLLVVCLLWSSCEDPDLNVQQDFPFEIRVMPVPVTAVPGQPVEIRMTISAPGNYAGTRYFLRYFQDEGEGTLQYYDQEPYLPNDSYVLRSMQFRLYYISLSQDRQSFRVWISDSFGNEQQLEFEFDGA